MKEKLYCGGIDVGGTKISSALFSEDGLMLFKEQAATPAEGGSAAAAEVGRRLEGLERAAAEAGGSLAMTGVCVPGIVFPGGSTVWAPNVRGWVDFPLGEELKNRTGARFIIVSDRSAYIAGEAWRGAARGARDAVFLAVGTGIGAGIMCGGRVVEGHGGVSGAVGWFGLTPEFKPEYAELGCFEAEASGAAVGRKARESLERGRSSLMLELCGGDVDKVDAGVVAEAARRGDPLALEIIESAAAFLAMGVANLVSALNPEVVVFGGGLFQAADLLLEPVRRGFRRWAQPVAARSVRVELSALGGDAGLYGCGRLAWETMKGEI